MATCRSAFTLKLHQGFVRPHASEHVATSLCRLPFFALMLAVFGCGGGYSPGAHEVKSETAKTTLVAVLDSWKAGETPDAWQQKNPSVVIQDFDWMGGAKLAEYEFLSEEAIDANLHCEVKLILDSPQNKNSKKTVKYLVSTSPVLTVFRAAQP